jgi:exosortase/archaeosortase family protein
VLKRLQALWISLPKDLRVFFTRVVILFFAWKTIYLLVLKPEHKLDTFLTQMVTKHTVAFLNLIKPTGAFHMQQELQDDPSDPDNLGSGKFAVYYYERRIIGIADACNALEIMVLYAGLIACYHAGIYRKIIFIAAGLIVIYLANVFRCAGLAWLNYSHAGWFDIAHKYLFKIFAYFIVCVLWFVFMFPKMRAHERSTG